MVDEETRKIKKVLDEEDAYVHVAMHYVLCMRQKRDQWLQYRKNGRLDRRKNVSRLVARLNDVVGISDVEPHSKDEENDQRETS